MTVYDDISFPTLPDRPYTIINMVTTVDGKAVAPDEQHPLFGGIADRPVMLELRRHVDALMYGATSALRHSKPGEFLDPKVQQSRQAAGQAPLIRYVTLSEHGRLAADAPLFGSPDFIPIVYVPESVTLKLPNADVRQAGKGRLDLAQMMQELKTKDGINTMVCEGGPTTNQPMLAKGLADELFVTIKPVVFGGKAIRTIVEGALLPAECGRLELVSAHPVESSEVFLRYRILR